jgi:hypothetical protein
LWANLTTISEVTEYSVTVWGNNWGSPQIESLPPDLSQYAFGINLPYKAIPSVKSTRGPTTNIVYELSGFLELPNGKREYNTVIPITVLKWYANKGPSERIQKETKIAHLFSRKPLILAAQSRSEVMTH